MLFIRRFRRRTGGHVTVRDYFLHSLHHRQLDPYVYFTPDSDFAANDLWAEVPRDRFVSEVRPEDYDIFFLGARDWKYVPKRLTGKKIIHAVLHLRHVETPRLRKRLARPAYRICNSEEVRAAVAPLANGVCIAIPNAVDLSLFRGDVSKERASVLIWGGKNAALARRLAAALTGRGVDARLLVDSVSRGDFAAMLCRADVFVGLPNATEGFYRPALEAMACGCAVVCSDAVGNRCYASDGLTCLQPAYDDFEGHLHSVLRLLEDEGLRLALRRRGLEKSGEFTLEAQRRRYYDFLESYILDDGNEG